MFEEFCTLNKQRQSKQDFVTIFSSLLLFLELKEKYYIVQTPLRLLYFFPNLGCLWSERVTGQTSCVVSVHLHDLCTGKVILKEICVRKIAYRKKRTMLSITAD